MDPEYIFFINGIAVRVLILSVQRGGGEEAQKGGMKRLPKGGGGEEAQKGGMKRLPKGWGGVKRPKWQEMTFLKQN